MIIRLINELEEIVIKRTKLEKFLDNNPDCPKEYIEMCCKQLSILSDYRDIIRVRIEYLIVNRIFD